MSPNIQILPDFGGTAKEISILFVIRKTAVRRLDQISTGTVTLAPSSIAVSDSDGYFVSYYLHFLCIKFLIDKKCKIRPCLYWQGGPSLAQKY